jgi:ribosomal protein L37E
VVEVQSKEEEAPSPPPPAPKKKVAKAKTEPIFKVTTLIPCQKCGERMSAQSLKYSHACGSVAAKAAPKRKPKPAHKTEAREEVAAQPASYHDLVKQRVQHLRDQREHRKPKNVSKALSTLPKLNIMPELSEIYI